MPQAEKPPAAARAWQPFRRPTPKELGLLVLCEETLGVQWADSSQFWGNRVLGSDRITSDPGKVERVMNEVCSAQKEGRIKTTPAQYAMHCWKTFNGKTD